MQAAHDGAAGRRVPNPAHPFVMKIQDRRRHPPAAGIFLVSRAVQQAANHRYGSVLERDESVCTAS